MESLRFKINATIATIDAFATIDAATIATIDAATIATIHAATIARITAVAKITLLKLLQLF